MTCVDTRNLCKITRKESEVYSKTEFVVQLTRAKLTQAELAEKTGMNLSTLNKKIQSGNFSRSEMGDMISALQIESPERFYEIFFAPDLRVTQEN